MKGDRFDSGQFHVSVPPAQDVFLPLDFVFANLLIEEFDLFSIWPPIFDRLNHFQLTFCKQLITIERLQV